MIVDNTSYTFFCFFWDLVPRHFVWCVMVVREHGGFFCINIIFLSTWNLSSWLSECKHSLMLFIGLHRLTVVKESSLAVVIPSQGLGCDTTIVSFLSTVEPTGYLIFHDINFLFLLFFMLKPLSFPPQASKPHFPLVKSKNRGRKL